MKRNVWLYLRAALYLVLAVGLMIVGIVEWIPDASEELKMSERLQVSSAPIDAEKSAYSTTLIGVVANRSHRVFEVEKLVITVGNGESEYTAELPGFVSAPRNEYLVEWTFADAKFYDRVVEISAYVDGNPIRIANLSGTLEWNFTGVILPIASFFFAWLFVNSLRVLKLRKRMSEQ